MQLDHASSSAQTSTSASDFLSNGHSRPRTIYPLGAYAIQGIAVLDGALVALDSIRGYLLKIDRETGNTTIINPENVDNFVDATGLAIWGGTLWYARDNEVYFCNLQELKPQLFVTMPYPVDGVGVWQSTVYIASQKEGYISIFEFNPQRLITRFPMPGVGAENLTVRGEELWVCDRTEQTVYCLDRATGEQQFCVLTPFESPTGLVFVPDAQTGQETLYVSYAGEEPYIQDNPNNPEDPLNSPTAIERLSTRFTSTTTPKSITPFPTGF